MAFPTSPSNNQVHKEGNRAFVYDSTLGTWDQVREIDRGENKIFAEEVNRAPLLFLQQDLLWGISIEISRIVL